MKRPSDIAFDEFLTLMEEKFRELSPDQFWQLESQIMSQIRYSRRDRAAPAAPSSGESR